MPNVESNLSRFQRWAKSLLAATMARKRTEITIETSQVLIIQRHRSVRIWCPGCGGEVEMVDLEDVMASGESGQRVLQDSDQVQTWHFAEGQDGAHFVCVPSMLQSMKSSPAPLFGRKEARKEAGKEKSGN